MSKYSIMASPMPGNNNESNYYVSYELHEAQSESKTESSIYFEESEVGETNWAFLNFIILTGMVVLGLAYIAYKECYFEIKTQINQEAEKLKLVGKSPDTESLNTQYSDDES